jgi:3-oxoacyl-[acyl-carrier protein] reductase
MNETTADDAMAQRCPARVAVVTGGSRGIGLGICKGLVEDGMAVAVVYQANQQAARQAVAELEAMGGRTLAVQADVSRRAEAARAVETVVQRWGRIDVLVNNAGVFQFAFLEEMDEAFLERMLRSNFESMIWMIQCSLPWLKRGEHARVVNASSISGRLADVGLIAYGSSKAGVDMLTRIASAELAPYGITVNAYAPGIIATEMTREMIEARGEEQVKQIPLGKFGTTEQAAGLVRYLCSPAADYVTGEVIGVDGGMLKVQNPFRAHEFARRGDGSNDL